MEQKKEQKEWKWPLGIFLFYMTFVVGTLSFVFFTFTQETDLVVEQYYEATITWQDHIDRSERALNLDEPLRVEQTGSYVDIIFPANMVDEGLSGTVHLYRPSGSSMDVKIPVNPDEEGVQRINLEGRAKGLWTVKIDWDHHQTGYFAESRLYLQ